MSGKTSSPVKTQPTTSSDLELSLASKNTETPNFGREVYCILGLPFDAVGLRDAQRRLRIAAATRTRCYFSTPNLNFAIGCLGDESFRNSVLRSDLSLPDGVPLVWIARLLRLPLQERVAGATLIEALHQEEEGSLNIFFFGGPDGAAAKACRRLNSHPKGLQCAGFEPAGFGTIEEMSTPEVIGRINASGAHILSVSLGARKGQAWITRNLAMLEIPVVGHLGAVVNFAAGTLRRAPVWMQRVGLEWLWRVREEPHLWRRYAGDGLTLVRLLLTRVLPHALLTRAKPRSLEATSTPRFEVTRLPEAVILHLSGPWTSESLTPLRNALRQLAPTNQNLHFDMSQVDHIDSAFLGLMMILYAHQLDRGRQLFFDNVDPALKRIFKFSCACFLIDHPRNK